MSGRWWRRLKAKLATPMMRRLLRRPGPFVLREQVAACYLRGDGIEVGALNASLRVPDGVRVRYVDCAAPDVLRGAGYGDVSAIKAPDVVAGLETLDGIDDRSVDFVIANHVVEHLENPLRAFATINRVLRPGGHAFIVLPDKRFTFDKRRAITPLWHIKRDFNDGPQWSRREHYVDWSRNVDPSRDADELERAAQNVHFHVWDFVAMREMFEHTASLPEIGLHVAHAQENRGEVIWVLRKP